MVGVPRGEFFTTDYTDYTDFFSREFALFAVDFGSTMRNPKEPSFLRLGVLAVQIAASMFTNTQGRHYHRIKAGKNPVNLVNLVYLSALFRELNSPKSRQEIVVPLLAPLAGAGTGGRSAVGGRRATG